MQIVKNAYQSPADYTTRHPANSNSERAVGSAAAIAEHLLDRLVRRKIYGSTKYVSRCRRSV